MKFTHRDLFMIALGGFAACVINLALMINTVERRICKDDYVGFRIEWCQLKNWE